MCGIVGLIDPGGAIGSGSLGPAVERMADTLQRRGPDDAGVWLDPDLGVALGHRRLSVIDVSMLGHQPMSSASGRYRIVYNGEVYNHAELRRPLEAAGAEFRGHSDTEVLLAAIEHWGIAETLERSVGMFAFGLWDARDRRIWLARDRMGEKPLYYGWVGRLFAFASELKALRVIPGWRGEINRDALALYMRHNYVPAPHSIYRGVHKLQPGCVIEVSLDECGDAGGFSAFAEGELAARWGPRPYWSFRGVVEAGLNEPLQATEGEAVDAVEAALRTSIREKLVADVPVGALLSGGIDSSTVVALMQQESSRPINTFSIGFMEATYNEAEYAKAVAGHLGTHHTELYVTPKQAMDVIPSLPGIYDEPFSDSSQIPTYLVSRLAREHVTVALSGDGGDELFGGYERYFAGRELWRQIGWLPSVLRRSGASVLERLPAAVVARLVQAGARVAGVPLRDAKGRVENMVGILAARDREGLYRELVSHWKDPAKIVVDGQEPATPLTRADGWPRVPSFFERMMALDTISYLPDDILTKVDRASMAVSLEARVPLLDHRVVELAWRLPLSLKVRGRTGKRPLRAILQKYVPSALIDRPKKGFAIPMGEWLRGPLRDWAESLLDPGVLEGAGFLRPDAIRAKWQEHLAGRSDWQYYLWDALMFQAWHAALNDQ
jgi:asparagine synthase (glutamine-hydrolysing)